jgi:WXG100 family type VII secretion target
MAEKIRVNYPALEDMAKNCEQLGQRLQQTISLANQTAQQMQNGAMVGQFGDSFVQALSVFQNKVKLLAEKFDEEARAIRGAMADMQRADQSAGGKF